MLHRDFSFQKFCPHTFNVYKEAKQKAEVKTIPRHVLISELGSLSPEFLNCEIENYRVVFAFKNCR